MKRWFLAALLLCVSAVATACPLCLGAFRSSAAQQLIDLPQAVLAQLSADGRAYRIVAVIKGARTAGEMIAAQEVQLEIPAAQSATMLLVRDDGWSMWAGLGAASVEHAGWLRQIATGKRPDDMNADEWRAHVALMIPNLENAEPLVAAMAYGELAAAPYPALVEAKPRLAAPAIRRWLADPVLAARQPLYLLLLGLAGDAGDATSLEWRLEASWLAGSATNLASMIAADLQLRGQSRMAWVDAKYMGDRQRSTRELDGALLALGVLGDANDAIPRERVIQSYRMFIREHNELAGLVAPELEEWQHWDAVPEYLALLKSDVRQHSASRVAILHYLRHSPAGKTSDLGVSKTAPAE